MEIILVILLVGALGAAAFFALKAQKVGTALEQANAALEQVNGALRQAHFERQQALETNAGLSQRVSGLQEQVQRLSRYQTIADAEAAAAAIRSQTESWAAQVRTQAESAAATLTTNARHEVNRLLAEGHTAHTQAQAAADAMKAQASGEATRIVEEANRRAEEIAGAALAAQRDAKRLEQTAQAMKNIIEGYGDRYVMPTAGLLDDLAEEFGFAEAGQRLKAARAKSRDMISDCLAATCDYAEANRRATAITFVLDAFNGKVDSILSDVKHDNHGTLEQKIRDAFLLVNQNGRAFRDARILPEYLDARLEELRWAVIAQELKVKAREEQRLLKERIREEERAQREFEKAKKDAEKEEESLRKSMEKALRDMEKSSDAERAKYEQKLRELTERLRLAEEKNQRALSMAQQTKSGHVYVISNIGSFGEDVFKIGMTRRLEPLDRVRELGDASVPFEFDVHAMIPSRDAPALERAIHQKFARHQVNKVNPRKEFFRVSLQEIRKEIEGMRVEATWTLVAEAREFQESQAIERALANKTIDETAWVEQQMRLEAGANDEREMAEEGV